MRRTVARSVTLILRHDPGARSGDPDDVHRLRVAARRLRSDLRTFAPLVDDEWATPLRTELSWLGSQVGAVRDVDVLIDELAPLVEDATGDALLDHFRLARSEASAGLLRTLLGERYTVLLDRAVAAAEAPLDLDRPARETVVPLVERAWRRLHRAVERLPSDPSDADLHLVRIRAKRCRYGAEAVAPVVGDEVERFAVAIADLQGVLGEHQDTVMAEEALRIAAATLPHLAPTAWHLIDHERAARARFRSSWPSVWAAAADPALRTWMGVSPG